MLKTTKLTKTYGKQTAIKDLDLEINTPGLYIFVGANGSGKSTFFNLVSGLTLPEEGEIRINNESDTNNKRLHIGISNEPFYTEPSLTVNEISDICLKIKKAPPETANQWLSFWELTSARDKTFNALSTGMKKRLSLALSLYGNPQMVLWDEPFNGLDPLGIKLLNELISRLKEQEKYILLSTHLLNEISIKEATYFILKEGTLIGTIPENSGSNQNEAIINLLKSN